MALTGTVNITVLDLATKRAKIVGTVIDDVAQTEITGEILDTVIDTADLAGERVRIIDILYAEYEAKKAKLDAIAALLATWEAALSSDLDAKVNP